MTTLSASSIILIIEACLIVAVILWWNFKDYLSQLYGEIGETYNANVYLLGLGLSLFILLFAIISVISFFRESTAIHKHTSVCAAAAENDDTTGKTNTIHNTIMEGFTVPTTAAAAAIQTQTEQPQTIEVSPCFKDYYAQTAYNCCSSGAYRNGTVELSSLISVLKQGVVCSILKFIR